VENKTPIYTAAVYIYITWTQVYMAGVVWFIIFFPAKGKHNWNGCCLCWRTIHPHGLRV